MTKKPNPLLAATIPIAAAALLATAHPVYAAEITLAPAKASLRRICFVAVDAKTRKPIPGASVLIEDVHSGSTRLPYVLGSGAATAARTITFDTAAWKPIIGARPAGEPEPTVVLVPFGKPLVLRQQARPAKSGGSAANSGDVPIVDVYIKVTAVRPRVHSNDTSAGTTRSSAQIKTFTNTSSGSTNSLIQGQKGVASDSNGQMHVRGEHADISYVIDDVPLPDTLSGRQGSLVVPSTIQSLDMLTGGFPAQFGGQTAAVLDIQTVPGAKKMANSLTLQAGGYGTFNTDFTSSGPLGSRASYVVNISQDTTNNALEPQQPAYQTAHNAGQDQSYFAKFRMTPDAKDVVSLNLSHAPSTLELSNRAGLPSRFASAGQGYGFLGLRNADGTRPDVTAPTSGLLGAQDDLLPSQQSDGMDISQRELNEFGTLSLRHQFNARDVGQITGVLLHSSQDVTNKNPAVDLNNLPVDNSIEYNPDSHRSVYHYQVNGDLTEQRRAHQIKAGFLADQEKGSENYTIVPASQLALNALAALDPSLAPLGSSGSALDADGYPVYSVAPGANSPTLQVHRSGYYDAAYIQDTWKASHNLTANYGLRYDVYSQKQDLGQPTVYKDQWSPRLNLSYSLAKPTILRASFDHLFNIPPLAQGAVVGQPIQPEVVDQYDLSLERQTAPGQTAKAAYYYKEIHNQVDTGLLIPGSEIGLYSAVNFQYGAVHGIELSYDFSPPKGVGWDGYLNYTYSLAQPNGFDNTGAPSPQYNDHDQRSTVGAGLAYLFKGGGTTALTLNYGSGLASSVVPPSVERTPRTSVDLHAATGPKVINGHGGFGLDISNLFDDRSVINFESGFSGTRFVEGRRVLLSVFENF